MTLPVLEGYELALNRGTRSRTGAPGPHYWQQWADYKLEAELNPVSKRMTGKGTDQPTRTARRTRCRTVYVQLLENIFAPAPGTTRTCRGRWRGSGSPGSRHRAAISRAAAGDGPGYDVNGTIMRIRLPKPLLPGGTADFAFDWKLRVPPDGAPRGGQDGEVFFLNYWYPADGRLRRRQRLADRPVPRQCRVLHGVRQLRRDPDACRPGWLVTATGTLQNPEDVLTAQTRARLDSARTTGAIVHVVTDIDREAGRSTTAGKRRQAHLAFPRRRTCATSPGPRRPATCGTPPPRRWATRTATARRTRR